MIKLTLLNGKMFMVGVNHLQAVITGATGDGAMIVLGGSLTYDVRESPQTISDMIDEYNARIA